MKSLTIQTSGAAPGLAKSIEFDAKKIADALQGEISGGYATQLQVESLSQDFVNRHNIIARYTSGTFLGFKIPDSALDEFETLKKY